MSFEKKMNEQTQRLIDDAVTSSKRAVDFDKDGRFEIALYYYRSAANLLLLACEGLPEEKRIKFHNRAREYQARVKQLEAMRNNDLVQSQPETSKDTDLKKCHFLFDQAISADEEGNKEAALELYANAVEHGLEARKLTQDTEVHEKLNNIARLALERAEVLKDETKKKDMNLENFPELEEKFENAPGPSNLPMGQPAVSPAVVPVKSIRGKQLHRGYSAHLQVTGGQDTYSEEEKRVLLLTSHINNKEYVPFMSIDLREKFQYKIPFTDHDGNLALSPKQKQNFGHWARPDEFSSDPKMIVGSHVDYFSIKQTVVSDCSFVASLAISALYEKRFGKRLISSIIYPKNKQGQPVYNPFGKYMIKLHINGIPRKVVIDDQLPVGKYGELLCSYSTNKNELWISLLEKAYMKVMGGYDFPGSNSNIDLYALTGWIPERIAIRTKEADFNADAVFEKLFTRFKQGDVLVTVATGELSDSEAERTGLVPTHAYALLNIEKIKNFRVMQLKNPWSHLRWRGNFSELDTKNWTEGMKHALNFDPNSASMFDNGVFWIDYPSVLEFFDVFYLNWNPELFQYTYCIHQSWKAGMGPIKDAFNIGDNPQYSLEVDESSSAIWILLSRHITSIEDFRENKEYITVLVYRNEGRRVYYPHFPPPFIDGIRINSIHYLCKILVPQASTRKFTLVISQYEKMHTIFYTLRAYSTSPFVLRKIGNPYEHIKEVTDGQWKGVTAGGCSNHPSTYMNNPRYQLTLESTHSNNQVLIDLKGPKQYQIGIEVICVSIKDPKCNMPFKRKDSGSFRSGYVVMDLQDLPAGTYDIVPSTFLPNQEGPFFLTVKSSCKLQLSKLR